MQSDKRGTENKPNRLIHDKSPYLQQHAYNPVDWFPWGDEAFQEARRKDKPIFVSIGYATCHWCHVMAHESFEDEEVARLLNESFVAVKVDREERPDIDQIYMTVCQSLTGRGGWPLSIFMTPEGKPFFAGTYFPKTSRMGVLGFTDILQRIAGLWQSDRNRVLQAGEEITNALRPGAGSRAGEVQPDSTALQKAYGQFTQSFDQKWGGFGAAPKFPTPHHFTFLLRWHKRNGDSRALQMVEKTLDEMRRGGIFDQIGLGFHRYSVDEKWLVPHFEKMLYDQALLSMAYTEAHQATGNEDFARVAREIFTYVLRDMTAPEGGFYSAEDADTEGREGLFYVWTPDEVKKHLGREPGEIFCRFYDITREGNFEDGHSIPHVSAAPSVFAQQEGISPPEMENLLEQARLRLFEAREKRTHPLKDDKILTSWNGLMIAALAKGYTALGDISYRDAAVRAADFVLKTLITPDGRLMRRYRHGEVAYPAYLDDHAFLVWGLLELYEATFDVSYLEEALALNRAMTDLFQDEAGGGFYFTGKGNEELIARSKEIYDGAIPSGNSVAALNLLRLGRMTGNVDLEKKAEELIKSFSAQVDAYPMGYTQFLTALDFMLGPCREIVIAGDPSHEATRTMVSTVHRAFLPNTVVLLSHEGKDRQRLLDLSPFLAPLHPINHQPTAYVCEQYACKAPVTEAAELKAALQ